MDTKIFYQMFSLNYIRRQINILKVKVLALYFCITDIYMLDSQFPHINIKSNIVI